MSKNNTLPQKLCKELTTHRSLTSLQTNFDMHHNEKFFYVSKM